MGYNKFHKFLPNLFDPLTALKKLHVSPPLHPPTTYSDHIPALS